MQLTAKMLIAFLKQHSYDKSDVVVSAAVHQMALADVTPTNPIRRPTSFDLRRRTRPQRP